jgi:hypothetical protein
MKVLEEDSDVRQAAQMHSHAEKMRGYIAGLIGRKNKGEETPHARFLPVRQDEI